MKMVNPGLKGLHVRCIDVFMQATKRTNDGLMLAHRLRRWPNIHPSLFQWLMFAGAFYNHIDPTAVIDDLICKLFTWEWRLDVEAF